MEIVTGFAAQTERWHDFYLMAGTAAVTLMGLLFVGLSIHLETVMRDDAAHLRALAIEAFVNFMFVLLVALTMLAPGATARPTGTELAAIGLARILLFVRLARQGGMSTGHGFERRHLLIRRLPAVAAYALMVWAGIALTRRPTPAWPLDTLQLVTTVLLLTAAATAWDLVMRVGRAHHGHAAGA